MALKSKVKTKRVIPPERKFANAMLIRESLRRLSGREAPGEMIARQQQRGRLLQDQEIQRRGLLRSMGESGMDSPGRFLAASRTGEAGLGSLIAAENQAFRDRRQGAVPMLNTLLRENKPYTKTTSKKGALEKAKPALQVAGAAAGAYFGGPAGAQMGMKAGGMIGDQGKADAPATIQEAPTSGGPPIASTQPNPPVSAGGPPVASTQTDQQIAGATGPTTLTQGQRFKSAGKAGLMKLLSMYGG